MLNFKWKSQLTFMIYEDNYTHLFLPYNLLSFLFKFQRLQGKRKRGLESINFVDANVDDYVDPSEVSKHFTEETGYVSHKSKDNQPTQQQKRKKQITYLAFQVSKRRNCYAIF